MRHEGKLTEWNDAKGFGFITPAAGGPRVFVHISAFPRDRRRPTVNEPITYHLAKDSQNRPKALKVGYLKAVRLACPRSRELTLACAIAAAFFALLAALSAADHVPMQLLAAYALLSVITFVMCKRSTNPTCCGVS
jgi:cold shock CspA family protein